MMAHTTTLKSRQPFYMSDETKTWFSRNVKKNLDALFGVAMRLTRSRADAEDLVAESVTQAWAAIDSLDDRDRFRPWIFRIMHNRFIDDCRKKSVRPQELTYQEQSAEDETEITTFLLEQTDNFLKWWADPESELVNRMLGEKIMQAIENLPEAFRIVILLVNVDGLRYDEASVVLGIPTGTVRSRMKRARTLLQKELWVQAIESGLLSPEPGSGI